MIDKEIQFMTNKVGGGLYRRRLLMTEPQKVSALYDWDFTQSMVDKVQGKEIALTTGYTQNSNGLKLSNPADPLQFLKATLSSMGKFTIELDVTSFTPAGSGNSACLIVTYSALQMEGVIWSVSSSKWTLRDFANTWYTIAGATSSSMFNGKTMKLQADFEQSNEYKLYCDDELIKQQTVSKNGKSSAIIGLKGYNATYTGLRIYKGLV